MTDKSTIVELVKRIQLLEKEHELTRKAQENLKESEERFRLISETIHFGVFETDDQGSWGGAAAQDWDRLAAAVDVFRIMTYDYTSRNFERFQENYKV